MVLPAYKKNIGVLENKGIEVMLSGDIIRASDFQWNSAITFSANFNKVKQLYWNKIKFIRMGKLLFLLMRSVSRWE